MSPAWGNHALTGIFVGIQTSLNDILHLEEIAPGKFRNRIMSGSGLIEGASMLD